MVDQLIKSDSEEDMEEKVDPDEELDNKQVEIEENGQQNEDSNNGKIETLGEEAKSESKAAEAKDESVKSEHSSETKPKVALSPILSTKPKRKPKPTEVYEILEAIATQQKDEETE